MSAGQDCWCEHADIGVGLMKVAENPGCPACFPDQVAECTCEFTPIWWGNQRIETPGCPAHCPTEVWPCPPKPGGLSTPHTPDWVPMRLLGIGPLVTDPDGAVVQHCSICQRLRPTTTEVTP